MAIQRIAQSATLLQLVQRVPQRLALATATVCLN